MVAALAVVGLASCASLSEKECRQGDWAAIGYADGLAGRTQARLNDHFKACGDYGIQPDPVAYRTAWGQGIEVYCQPGNGFEVGRRGRAYNGVCPTHLEAAFLESYRVGSGLHDREEAVDEAEDEIKAARRRLDEVEIRLDALEGDLAAGKAPQPDRVRAKLVDLAEERGALKERIRSLETDYERARADLRRYRSEVVGVR
jgi:hypothetical protein